ncbi:MAG: DUF1566 domain-containing protein [Rikenellaceae bacterium]
MKRIILIALIATAQVTEAQITYPIVGTNQTLFYNNSTQIEHPAKGDMFYGQDAQHEGNKPSYTDNGDGTITDNVTGLVWQKEFKVMSYNEAMALSRTLTLGGHSSWRLPSIKEAYSLIQFNGVDASSRDMTDIPQGAVPFIDTNYFDFSYGSNGTRPIDTQMLSSTIYVGSSARQKFIFGVNLADGRIKSYPMNTRGAEKVYTVRLVRGVEYGVNNFVDNGDKTISDTATGLMWQKDDSGKGLNWQEALEYAQKMNDKKYLGYTDWRVPDAKELQSIVDYTRSPESTNSAAIDPIFTISEIKNEGGEVDYPFFWSSTTHLAAGARGGATTAEYVAFGRGLGNMKQMGAQRVAGSANGGGQQQQRQQRPQQQQQQNMRNNTASSSSLNWINIHGAGCQRSDPKSGDASRYASGRGPQGDAIRINNYVRLVRDINSSVNVKDSAPAKVKKSKPTAAASTPTNGIVAHWSFDNDSPGVVVDSSTNGNNGVSSRVTYTQGVVGKAAYFDGIGSKVIIPDTPKEIVNLKNGTISCWFKFENVGGQVLPILYLGKATSGRPNHSMVIEVGHDRGNPSNRRLYLTTIVGRGSNFCVDSNNNLDQNRWYHYVAVVSKSGNTIYIDGKEHTNRRYNLGSNSSYTTFFDDVPTKELLSIGYGKYSQEDPFYSFKGYIDELKIYDYPLSSKEVKSLYGEGLK